MSARLIALTSSVLVLAAWIGRPTPAPKSMTYLAHMTGAQETPANNAKGTGNGTLTIDGTKMSFKIEVKDLSGAPTAAHIHVGAAGVAGGPVYTFALKSDAGKSGTIAEGSVDLMKDVSSGVTGDSLKVLLNTGKAYVNVHTGNFPGGEIRGQLSMKM
jgi:hypothetical protein